MYNDTKWGMTRHIRRAGMSGQIFRCAYSSTVAMTLLASLTAGTRVGGPRSTHTPGFANPAFERRGQRTDRPVAKGLVTRTWIWGRQPGKALTERYQKTPDGSLVQHEVQYFDKARMEINDPTANPNS